MFLHLDHVHIEEDWLLNLQRDLRFDASNPHPGQKI